MWIRSFDMAGEKIPLGKYWRPILIILVIVIAIWLATVSGAVLIPFLLGVLIAYLLMPLVRWLEKRLPPKGKGERAKRICSVAIVFVGLLVIMVLFMTYIGSIVISASGVLIEKAPVLLSKSTEQIGNWIKDLRMVVPQAWLIQLDATMQDLGPQAGKYIQDFAIGAMSIIPASLPTIMSFLILPFFLFFMMMDYDAFRKFFYDYMPSKSAKQAGDVAVQ
jgi:predicted PurR-regulated permease PerM